MAMIFSDLLNMDTEKILKMALLHDLTESITGDITPESMPKKDKVSVEDSAMTEILGKLNPRISKEYGLIWKEYLEKSSSESILLHQIDKLEMALQANSYQKISSEQKVKEFLESAKLNVTDDNLKKILEQITRY